MTPSRRRSTLAAVALGAVAVLAGCSAGGGGGQAAAPLSFLVFETPALTAEFWDDSIAAAEESVPGVSVDKIVSPDADRNAYAKQLQASGQFPDLLASINPGDFLEAGLLEPFDEAWLEDNFVLPEASAIDGKTYQTPSNAQILPLVYYNKAIFAEQGIEVPTNYAEFLDAIAQLRAADITPLELAGAEAWAASMPVVALASVDVLGSDPEWIQERYEGEVSFTDPLFADAMQKAVDLVEMGAYDPAALSVDFVTANRNFLEGKSAMYPMGSWFSGTGYVTPEQAENIGVFPWPSDDGDVVLPLNVGGAMSVSAVSKDVPSAVKFAEAWTLAPSNMKVLIESDGAIPLLKGVELEEYGADVTDLYRDGFDLLAENGESVSSFGWVNNSDALAPGINNLFYALAQSFFSNTDVEAQLAQLDQDWDAAVQ